MIFTSTKIAGVMIVDLKKIGDDRGFFARAFDEVEFEQQGLPTRFVQANISRSVEKGTVRGMHFQKGEHAEDKLVRCTKGKLFDVALDLRPESATFKQWFGVELSEETHRALLIPRGCAHGFMTLEENSEAFYLVSNAYAPESESGVKFNDPAFNIQWPAEMTIISEKDNNWPDFTGDNITEYSNNSTF